MGNWISVEDRMPENKQKVIALTYRDNYIPDIEDDYSIGVFSGGNFHLGYDDVDHPHILKGITHWKVLTEPRL